MTFYNRHKPIDVKLRAAMKHARFSIMDLATWLDRPYSSVYQWLAGQVPREPFLDEIRADVILLRKWKMKEEKYNNLRGKERREEIRRLSRHARRARPPRRRAAG